jgi:L-ribulose-5-phosphate 3-epimerase
MHRKLQSSRGGAAERLPPFYTDPLLLSRETWMAVSRRSFLSGLAAGALASVPLAASATKLPLAPHGIGDLQSGPASGASSDSSAGCPFRLAVINDEISEDFDHACSVAARDFGLHWIELRGMWNKNLTELDDQQLAKAQLILKKYNLRVTDIASPLYKVDFPGAPRKDGQKRDEFHADYDFKEQDALLEHCIGLAQRFGTDRIRCFDFWRLADQKPFRAAINDKLKKAAQRCARENIVLLLENEMSCNTATGAEAATVLAAIPDHNFMLNWDPGNAGTFPGAVPYPHGYDLLPKERIGHCHVKNVKREANGKFEWEPVGIGVVDWVGQFRALKQQGYHDGVSLETHWRGAGTPEASTRISMGQMKHALAEAGTGC